MLHEGWFDYDLIASQSLNLLRQRPGIAALVAGRYPQVLVDEYQDLGPVFHELVLCLGEHAAISAFGDADQSVMTVAGAHPRFLNELPGQLGCKPVALRTNHRSGNAVINASTAVLLEPRPYQARADRCDPGTVRPVQVAGDLTAHASAAVAAVTDAVAHGVDRHQIAILYPDRKGPCLAVLLAELNSSPHRFVHERDEDIRDGDLTELIRECAARMVAAPDGHSASAGPVLVPMHALIRQYEDLRASAGLPAMTECGAARVLGSALGGHRGGVSKDEPLEPWLDRLSTALGLDVIAAANGDFRNRDALEKIRAAARNHRLAVGDIAAGAIREDKIALTTYHSAKGREWEVVIMPGLVQGTMPAKWMGPEDGRRLLYVGITRAKQTAVLIHGEENRCPEPVRDILRTCGNRGLLARVV